MKTFNKDEYINHGKWVQDPISGVFWSHAVDAESVRRVLGENPLTNIIGVNHNWLQKKLSSTYLAELIYKITPDEEKLKGFRDNFVKELELAKKNHLAVLTNTYNSDQEQIKDLFKTYHELTGVWWLSGIIFAPELEKFIKTNTEFSTDELINEQVKPFRRPTLLEQQAKDIKKIAQGLDEKVSYRDYTLNTQLKSQIDDHVVEYDWFGTHHWAGDGYSIEKCIEDINEQIGQPNNKENLAGNSKQETLWQLVADVIFWRTHCAEVSAKVVFRMRDLLTQQASALGLSYAELSLLSAHEIEVGMENGNLPTDFRDREESYVCYVEDQVETIISNKGVQPYIDMLLDKVDTKQSEYRGVVASKQGIVTGEAMVVMGPKDFDSFKEGQILIAPETTPDFVPLMKKASAIIVEVGGITCHAAIVSRELGKPCITLVKEATQIFNNKDLLEVNSENGVIKIITK